MTVPAYRADGLPVAPDAFYATACDPAQSVVVEACAGAGKTWMLVSRILRALLAGAEPSQILAITFTKKAAGEMRQRLDEWLLEFAAPDCPPAKRVEALQQRGLDLAAAQALAPALGDLQARLLHGGRPVQVQTFHGWFAQLLSGAPLAVLDRLGLAQGLQLLEDAEPLRAELMRDFHRVVDADLALRADFLALVRRHRRNTLQDWLDAAWQRRGELEAAAAAGTLSSSVPLPARDPAQAMADAGWRARIAALAQALGSRDKTLSNVAATALIDALADPEPRQAFNRAWSALMTDGGTPRKRMGDLPAQAEVCDALLAMNSDWQQQDAHDDHQRMSRLSLVLLQAYKALKRRLALADMDDLERVGTLLLSEPGLSGWVQSRLDVRVRHLLIDEFQDTSPQQWQALRQWLSGYAGAGGGASGQRPLSVFIVGDPKQSIYRFRRAEPRVFTAAREFVQQALHGRWLACDHTRRNAPEIIAALNEVFTVAARDEAWPGFRPHTGPAEPAGGVWYLPDAVPDEAAEEPVAAGEAGAWRASLTQARDTAVLRRQRHEAHAVAQAIAGQVAAGALAPSEVMVLARRRRALAQVAEALAAEGLPYTVPESMALADTPEAQDLIALLDVLASPGHSLSLARALKSPLFGVADSDLVWLSQAAPNTAAWSAVLTGETPLPTPALIRARGLLRAWAEAAERLPPHDLLDRIVHEGEVVQRLAAALPAHRRRAGLQAVDALLAAALELDGGRYATPYGFVRALRQAGTAVRLPAPADAIRLLTVHGAKGLEAKAVFLIDTDTSRRPAERSSLLVDWPAESPAPACVAFVAREAKPPPSLVALLDVEQDARAREKLNGLYVAMTRAREWLVLSRTEPGAAVDPGSWWTRVEAVAQPWPHAAAVASPLAEQPVQVPAWPVRPGRPGLVQPSTDAAEPNASTNASPHDVPRAGASLEPDAAAPLGRAVHRLLEWISRPDLPLPRGRWSAAARAAAQAFLLPVPLADEVLAIASRIVDSPPCAPFFDPAQWAWAGNEVPVTLDGTVLRIDRLVALHRDGQRVWWVLDYKLAGQPGNDPALRAQLHRYREAVRQLQPGDLVQAAFITGQGQLLPLDP
jgi:ATP-dependent helicase/nuclease subunit A